MFGSSTSAPAFGGFGNSSSTQFGNKPATGFGNSGGLFGNSTNTNNSNTNTTNTGLFGSANNTSNTSNTSNTNANTGPFGSTNTTNTFGSTGGGGLFGSNNSNTGGLFGSNNSATNSNNPAGSNTLFGSNNTNSGGLFGSKPSGPSTGTSGSGGLFGSQNQSSGGGLFGSNQSGGLFGNKPQTGQGQSQSGLGQSGLGQSGLGQSGLGQSGQSGGLFGSQKGGLFGQNNTNSSGLFDNKPGLLNTTQQQTPQVQLTAMTRVGDLPPNMKQELEALDQYINTQHHIATTLQSDYEKHDNLIQTLPKDINYLQNKLLSTKQALKFDSHQLGKLRDYNNELTDDLNKVMQLILQLSTPGTKLSSGLQLNEFFIKKIKKYHEVLKNYDDLVSEVSLIIDGLERSYVEGFGTLFSVVEVIKSQYALFMELCETLAQLHSEVNRLK